MASLAVQERRKRLVNRVGRHLPCNTMDRVTDFANVATKIVENIVSKPEETKFRELRASNKTISRAIMGCHGGREFLHLLGFEKIAKHGEAVYFLADPHLDHLAQAKDWLAERVAACAATAGASGGGACADSVLKILLTSGQTLEGGFYKHEKVCDVYVFLQSSVVSQGEELRLRTTTSPPQDLWEEMLPLTLADAKLVPKATLVVVKPTAVPLPTGPAPRSDADEAEALRKLQAYSARKSKDAAAEKEKMEVMAKFRADRAGRQDPNSEDNGVEETKGGRR